MTQLTIDGRVIDGSHPPYVIAELSANHKGSVNAAIELIHAAHEAGADAVKFQHFTPESITVRSSHPRLSHQWRNHLGWRRTGLISTPRP
jgi:sialic acid synthase SpsE